MIGFYKTLLCFAVASAETININIEYSLPKTGIASEWFPYGTTSFESDSVKRAMDREYQEGKVIGSVSGDAVVSAEKIWDAYQPPQDLFFRIIAKTSPQSIVSMGSVDMSRITSERMLGKALANLDFTVLVDSENNYLSSGVRVHWDDLKDAEVSRRRIGLLVLQKPVQGNKVVLPKALSPSLTRPSAVDAIPSEDPTQAPPPEIRQPGFFGKYWWAILGGAMIFNMMAKEPEPATNETAPQAPAQVTHTTASSKKQGKK